MTMKKKAGRASSADLNNVIGLAVSQAKSRVETLGSADIADVSGGGLTDLGGSGGVVIAAIKPVDITTIATMGMFPSNTSSTVGSDD